MYITKRAEYALRALVRLGLEGRLGRPVVPVAQLAAKENLPLKFLEGILVDLRKAGMIERVRGKETGARLAASSREFSAGDVIRTIDGDYAPTACTSKTTDHKCSCPDMKICGVRMLMKEVHAAAAKILDGHSLVQVVDAAFARMTDKPGGALPTKLINDRKVPHADPYDGLLAAIIRTKDGKSRAHLIKDRTGHGWTRKSKN